MMMRGQRTETLEVSISRRGLTVKAVGRRIALSAIAALTLLGLLHIYVVYFVF
jgi:hypothetical protein